jgi:hypothetical protein
MKRYGKRRSGVLPHRSTQGKPPAQGTHLMKASKSPGAHEKAVDVFASRNDPIARSAGARGRRHLRF